MEMLRMTENGDICLVEQIMASAESVQSQIARKPPLIARPANSVAASRSILQLSAAPRPHAIQSFTSNSFELDNYVHWQKGTNIYFFVAASPSRPAASLC
jgi:hypothetical protein